MVASHSHSLFWTPGVPGHASSQEQPKQNHEPVFPFPPYTSTLSLSGAEHSGSRPRSNTWPVALFPTLCLSFPNCKMAAGPEALSEPSQPASKHLLNTGHMPRLAGLADPWKQEAFPPANPQSKSVRSRLQPEPHLFLQLGMWSPRPAQPSEGLLTSPACTLPPGRLGPKAPEGSDWQC